MVFRIFAAMPVLFFISFISFMNNDRLDETTFMAHGWQFSSSKRNERQTILEKLIVQTKGADMLTSTLSYRLFHPDKIASVGTVGRCMTWECFMTSMPQ